MKQAQAIDLSVFSGPTQNYFDYQQLAGKLILTDGTHYVHQQSANSWLFDVILTFQSDKRVDTSFQQWKLRKRNIGEWLLLCEAYNGTLQLMETFYKQEFPELPFETLDIIVMNSVCMLYSELFYYKSA